MQQLLLMRPKPLPDELLSSWLVRLAWENGQKLHPFTHRTLGLPSKFWNRDPDRFAKRDEINLISSLTAISTERVTTTTLASYVGYVFNEHRCGPDSWVLPIGQRARYWTKPGLQFCPGCLIEDPIPYFRRLWRFSFMTCCTKHGTRLVDHCYCCTRPINAHCGDYQSWLLTSEQPWTLCCFCGSDFRLAPIVPADALSIWITRVLEDGLKDCWIQIGERSVHLTPALIGLRVLARMVASNTRSRRFSICVSRGMGALPFATEFSSSHQYFDALDVNERHRLIAMVAWLVEDWPTRFVWAGRRSKLSKAYIRAQSAHLPFWLSVEVEWKLDGGYYSPNEDEREAVLAYLVRHRLSTAENNVRRWLGMSYFSRNKRCDHLAPKENKWPGYAKRKRLDNVLE